ncbi:putative polysaccharide biosynthesis protein [Gracilibacillus thailandensis]|uniref:Oligosaccharide flippase family protein n=1 Tax=Gracilibacillus thailandensis TaxID=563735 RepID=A0A6N7R5N8_9BACI|nr:polysaccharide biosynthesis protein [Gracilibacillus thailandensis]MRI68450.1 oligosaccharide flippase family protein [Gracilibacillus thailandensis]
MSNDKQNNQVYRGAFALLLAGILSKVISAFYRIPLQNLTGDIGFYTYQQVYPILGIAFMLALYGFPAAISKFLAVNGKEQHHQKMYISIFTVMMGFAIFLFLTLFLLSPVLANWMGDHLLTDPLRHVSWVFLFIPFVALFRGITQSDEWMEPTAYSQMIEQLLRATIIIVTAILIYQGHLHVYKIADGAMIASIIALSISFIFIYLYTKKNSTWNDGHSSRSIPISNLISPVIVAGLIISMNHMLLLLMQLADAFTMVPGLLTFGETLREATATKGVFDRGQPLLQLVTVVGSSFAMALVPQVTKINWQISREETIEKLRLTTKYCILLSVGATVGLFTLFPEVNQLLFQNQLGTSSLRILTLSLLFTSLTVTTASTLQGFGYMKWTAIILFLGLWVKMVLNYFLIPLWGVDGAAIATVSTVIIICMTNFLLLRSVLNGDRLFVIPWIKVIIASLVMAIALTILKQTAFYFISFENRIALFLFVIGSVIIGFIVYAIVVVKWRILTRNELAPLPLLNRWKKG